MNYELQMVKQAAAFIKNKTIPDVSSKMHHCKKGGSKLKWKQENFVLMESGIFSVNVCMCYMCMDDLPM